ncbi:glycogen-debranching protein [Chloroflexia bacterium SDU3-3]|nr:glycogen-debranching protein [Chloroflexia bacterium SDU3-3]
MRARHRWEAEDGSPAPLGVRWIPAEQAYNFALYSRHATSVTLLLYGEHDVVEPCIECPLDHFRNKTGYIWHCRLPLKDMKDATYYAYRVDGPFEPRYGHRFNPQKLLLDPYAPAVFFPRNFSREAAIRPGRNDGMAPLGIIPPHLARSTVPRPLRPTHTHDTVIYEVHVKGFTAHHSSGVSFASRGTFAGLIEKIPYLKDLGVTAVELLPVHQYDPEEGNYWGYMTLNFFSPHHAYSASGDAVAEFRVMVDAFHEAGIEVLLDVVYNHTTEGDERGPTYSMRGLDNSIYYLLKGAQNHYANDAGTGNVLRCARPVVRKMIIDSLRLWAAEMGVDGFRFDLASIFTRNDDGSVNLGDPPMIAEVSSFAAEYDVRLIAEAWDIDSYQLGRSFPGTTWLQWNGKFRDDIRAFVRGDPGKVPDLMRRLYGSDDLFPDTLADAYRPYQSVNFITAHDGFCLYDLVSYNHKHNEVNGHNNMDGSDNNISWNCGWEGDAGVPDAVMRLRKRQVRNFFTLLLLANGTPMFCAGDEFLNTQRGNNNPYNQDNEITWLNWDLLERNRATHRFVKHMIAFRKAHPTLGRSRYWREDIRWYGVGPAPDLAPSSHSIAFCLHGESQLDDDLYVMINGYHSDLLFELQEGAPGQWLRVVDTSLPSPDDIAEPGSQITLYTQHYSVRGRSIVVLRRPFQGKEREAASG